MKKFYMIVFSAIIIPLLTRAQLQSVNIQSIVGCGGATIIGQPIWNGTSNPTTIYFERQGAAGTWFEHRSMVYDYQTNHITLTPTDLSGPTNFRVRAVDMVTFEERISGGVALNPANWNVDRGTAFGTASVSWGATCANPGSMLVTTNYTVNGRPPFLVEYKKSSDPNYLVAGTVTAGTVITGIQPGAFYQARITDICGKVVNVNAGQLNFGVSASIQQPTNCNNGRFQIFPSGGIGPYTYGIFKRVAGMGGLNPVISFDSTGAIFNNLGPGDYFYQAKDACGNLSRMELARLGGGFPFVQNLSFPTITPGDSCTRNITVVPLNGQAPLEYGVRYIHASTYTWQTSPTFTLNTTGVWFFRTRDACGQISDSLYTSITISAPQIDSAVKLSTSCIKDIRVYASGGYGPYQYAMLGPGHPNYVYQASNTFMDVTPGQHYVKVRDRCGRETGPMLINDLVAGCDLRYDHGDFEAANTVGCQTHSGSDWIDIRDDQNSLVFSINPQNNTIPDMCWGIRIIPRDTLRYATVNGSKAFFLDRNFYIEPAAGLTLTNPVLLRFYITYIELQDMVRTLQQNGYPNATINDLRILKKKGSPGSPVDLEVINEGAASAGQFTIITPLIYQYGMEYVIQFAVNDFSELNPFAGELGALPLTLLSFEADADNKDVLLKWKTTDEVNTRLFEVLWSTTGINFQKIGTVSSNNRPGINNYQFKHIAPGKGLNYYRLKQVDIDGKFTFSATIKVTVDNLSGLAVYPNPVYDQLQLRADATEIVRAVTITDAAGRLQLHMATTGNVRPVIVPVQKLSRGIYWLQVTTDRKTYRLKFIRQ